jgi:ABC-2 type transport system ATP-binding protein
VHRPQLLVLDEPIARSTPTSRCVRTGSSGCAPKEGTALLVTSHNMVEVERLCERVVFVSGGEIVADGTPGAVAARFGREDLEGVFLHLAAEAGVAELDIAGEEAS